MRVGQDVFAQCRRCGETWHVVVAVVPGRPSRVECKQCSGRHGYRAPSSEIGEKAASPRRPRLARSASTASPAIEADLSRPVRPYRRGEQYAAGERVAHPNFGEGVVQAEVGPTKVRILFANGPRTLVQTRSS